MDDDSHIALTGARRQLLYKARARQREAQRVATLLADPLCVGAERQAAMVALSRLVAEQSMDMAHLLDLEHYAKTIQ